MNSLIVKLIFESMIFIAAIITAVVTYCSGKVKYKLIGNILNKIESRHLNTKIVLKVLF